jgi:hypothetical protein
VVGENLTDQTYIQTIYPIMEKELQYTAMEKLLNSLVKPKFEKIIDEIKVIPPTNEKPTRGINDRPRVKVYLTSNLLNYTSVENTSGVSFEDIQELVHNIDWEVTKALRLVGRPKYWIEVIQKQS